LRSAQPTRSADEHILEYRRHSQLQAFFRQRRTDRGIDAANHLPSRRAPRHFPEGRGGTGAKTVGDQVSVSLEPEDGFGDYDADLVRIESQDRFPPEVKVGMQFEGQGDSDDQEGIVYTVTDIAEGKVVVDGNHQLAGQRLRFDCTVLDVRPATAEELAHGHVHGAHGHHH
jgi:FKBP-type peptidyl-prolyl cis-trans isomerase SlyD